MKDPYIYKVVDGVKLSQLKKINGITKCSDYYLYRRKLYKSHITLELRFYTDDDDGIFMLTSVNDMNTKGRYASFYNPIHRINNEVYTKVYHKYKDIMKELEKLGVVEKDYKIKEC